MRYKVITGLAFLGILVLFAVGSKSAKDASMDTLASPFTISVEGKPIADVGESTLDTVQAKIGSKPATFSLKNGWIHSGDWVLGRATRENRSLLPKQVFWFKTSPDVQSRVQPVQVRHKDGRYEISFSSMLIPV
ncbi:hypothetical protein BDZ85DRAFT_15039 [Elsinoe ampelina]|uniref:Uncharacterized protein n=1 Tax=Elsinoe ampelina TaxID=302913 RepID=A0A6A6G799_9PEZI|nr:hypothetical protein BDZ85DRAFT_15039 [Elsinoe ampelina]